MKVAVILPALNAEHLIIDQLAALARQDYPGPFDILVCDNGSTDRTRELAEEAGATVLDASAVRGTGPARNVGARWTDADHLLFCDADDVVSDGWVRAMVAALAHHPVVFGQIEIAELNTLQAQVGRPVAPALQCGENGLPFAGDGNMAIHRDVFLELGGFDEVITHLHDVDFCWRLLAAGYELAYEPAAINHIRLRNSMSGVFKQGFTYGRGWALVVAKHRETAERLNGHFDALLREHGIDGATKARRSRLGRPGRVLAELGTLARGVKRHPIGGVGFAIWQLGWKLGFRQGQRELLEGDIVFGSLPVPSPLRDLDLPPDAVLAGIAQQEQGGPTPAAAAS